MFPTSPRTGPRGHRLRGVFFALKHRPPLGDSRFLLFFGSSPSQSGFLMIGVFVVFLCPLWPTRVRTSVRMVDAIAGRVVEKGRGQPPPDEPDGAPLGAVGAAGSGSGTGAGRRWRGRNHHNGFCRSVVTLVPRIHPRFNGGITRSERLHRAKVFGRVAFGHFRIIRHTGGHRPRISLVAVNHRVIFSQCR